MATFAELKDLREFVQFLLISKETQKIHFRHDNQEFHGFAFAAIAQALSSNSGRMGHIRVGAARMPPNVGAYYDTDINTLVFPEPIATFGRNSGDRATIIHECVHALYDARGFKPPRSGRIRPAIGSLGIRNEASAYIADALYDIHSQTPADNMTPKRPYWAMNLNDPDGSSWTIAEKIWKTPGATVSAADAAPLYTAIQNSPTYADLKANPGTVYFDDGIGRR